MPPAPRAAAMPLFLLTPTATAGKSPTTQRSRSPKKVRPPSQTSAAHSHCRVCWRWAAQSKVRVHGADRGWGRPSPRGRLSPDERSAAKNRELASARASSSPQEELANHLRERRTSDTVFAKECPQPPP